MYFDHHHYTIGPIDYSLRGGSPLRKSPIRRDSPDLHTFAPVELKARIETDCCTRKLDAEIKDARRDELQRRHRYNESRLATEVVLKSHIGTQDY